MRYAMEQRVIHNRSQWVVFDRRQPHDAMAYGSHTTIANLCREWNEDKPKLTQAAIDGDSSQRKGFDYTLSQLRAAILGKL